MWVFSYESSRATYSPQSWWRTFVKGKQKVGAHILILNGKISITFQTPIFENKTNKWQKNIRQVTLLVALVTSYVGSAELDQVALLAFITQITGVVCLYSYAKQKETAGLPAVIQAFTLADSALHAPGSQNVPNTALLDHIYGSGLWNLMLHTSHTHTNSISCHTMVWKKNTNLL